MRAYAGYAESETDEGFEVVDVDFGVPQPSGGEERRDTDVLGVPAR
jgi:hypothetical protein